MIKTKIVVAAVTAVCFAGPALAQDYRYDQGQRSYDQRPYDQRQYDQGFWPGQAAGDVVGGAIGTAGAIATAPFRAFDPNTNSYAMGGPGMGGSEYCAQRYRSYDPQSGTFLGYDGRRHPCQ